MEKNYKTITVNHTAKWACYVVAGLAFVLAILCIVSSVAYFVAASLHTTILLIGIDLLITAIALLFGGVMVIISTFTGPYTMAKWTFYIGSVFTGLNGILYILSAIYQNAASSKAGNSASFAMDIFFAIIYISTSLVLSVAYDRGKKGYTVKIIATIGSIMFAVSLLVEFIYSTIILGPNGVVTTLYCVGLLLAAMLIVVSLNTYFYNEKVPVSEEDNK